MSAQRQSVPLPDKTGIIMHGLDDWRLWIKQRHKLAHLSMVAPHISTDFSLHRFPYTMNGAQQGFCIHTHLSNNQIGTTCHDIWVYTPGWSVFIGSIQHSSLLHAAQPTCRWFGRRAKEDGEQWSSETQLARHDRRTILHECVREVIFAFLYQVTLTCSI